MNIHSRTLIGYLDQANRNSIDWSLSGVIAYGCQSTIAIFDPKSIQIIQTLDNRKGTITKLKWSNSKFKHNLNKEIKLKLASGDDLGNLVVWDVCEGCILNEFNETSNLVNYNNNTNSANYNNFKPAIIDIKWLNYLDNASNNDDYLLALHSTNTLILWNTDTGAKIWTKVFNESILQITLDPYLNRRVALLSANYIQFIEDFSCTQAPQNPPRRFHITNTSNYSNQSNDDLKRMNQSSGGGGGGVGIFTASYWFRALVENATNVSDVKQKQDQNESAVSLNDCIQIEFSQLNKNILYVLYSKEIFIFDLIINQTVGYVQLERSSSLFIQMHLCAQHDVIYCLHDNGSISARIRLQDRLEYSKEINYETLLAHDFAYDTRTQSDHIRVTKSTKPFSFVVSPINEKNLVLLMSDGRLLMYELAKQSSFSQKQLQIDQQEENEKETKIVSYETFTKKQRQYLKDLINVPKGNDVLKLNLRLHLNSVLTNLPPLPFVMKICPPMTRKNFSYYESLLAVGCTNGDLYVYQLETASLWRKYSLHTYPIRGIEWVSLKSVLTWSNTGQIGLNNLNPGQSSSSGNNTVSGSGSSSSSALNNPANIDLNLNTGGKQLVKNEIIFTDLTTGETRIIRQDVTNEESPILSIKTSYLKQYFIIIFKEQPLEIWDLKSFTLIRRLSDKSPVITILEWSPSFTKKPAINQPVNVDIKRKFSLPSQSDDQTSVHEDMQQIEQKVTTTTPETQNLSSSSSSSHQQNLIVKENFICIDISGLMYSFYVEGHTIKDGSKVLLEDGSLSNIISIALKNDYIVFGDEYGNLSIWELKNKISKTIHTKRGAIRKLKFAPGKENLRLLILYSLHAVEIFDLNKLETISYLKIKEKFYDIDWCSCDKPIILMSDGCVRIFDINLKQIPNQLDYLKYSMNMFNSSSKSNFLNKKLVINEYLALKYLLFDSIGKNFNYESILNKKLSDYFLNEKNYQQNLNELFNNLDKNLILLLNLTNIIETSENNLLKALNLVFKYELLTTQAYLDCQFENRFWQIVRNFLKIKILSSAKNGELNEECLKVVEKLPNLDGDLVIYDTKLFRLNELKYLKLYEQKRVTNLQNKNLINDLLLANQLDKVFNLLLETEPSNGNYLNDYLKACLVNSMKLNELLDNNDINVSNLKSSIKLIATNLIANGKLNDGIQLLCLIGLVFDACRYLQDNSQWDKAIWLAKMRLNDEDLNEVIKRWSDYLCTPQVNKKNHAILLLVSGGQFSKAIEIMLNYNEYTQISLHFLDLCLTYGLLKIKQDDTSNEQQPAVSSKITAMSHISKELCYKVYAKNAKLIYKLDNMNMFQELCKKAGPLGEELLAN